MKQRLDQALVTNGLVSSRSQAESYIKLGQVKVNGQVASKAGQLVTPTDDLTLTAPEQYVSRAGLKLASVAQALQLDFKDKVVLDVGSSTGGFTDYALQHGAEKVIAVEVGSHQLHPSLLGNAKIELHEQTDIRSLDKLSASPDIVVIDVSFISLSEILPHIAKLVGPKTVIAAMLKPQFETEALALKHKGIIKNDQMRRKIMKDFEDWTKKLFTIQAKADSEITGAKGNRERFYRLQKLSH